MSKRGILSVGDRIVSERYGRWLVTEIGDEYMTLVKVRKGRITETWKVRLDHAFGGKRK